MAKIKSFQKFIEKKLTPQELEQIEKKVLKRCHKVKVFNVADIVITPEGTKFLNLDRQWQLCKDDFATTALKETEDEIYRIMSENLEKEKNKEIK